MRRKIAEIEGARGLAACAVLAYHVGKMTDGDTWLSAVTSRFWLGVPLFFVLSGYLLFRPFAAAVIGGHPLPSLRRYGRGRLLRIAPAYWLVLTATIILQSLYMLAAAIAAGAIVAWAVAYVKRSRLLFLAAVTLSSLAALALVAVRGEIAWAGFTNYFLVYLPFGPYGLVGPAWTLCIEVGFYCLLPLLAFVGALIARPAQTSRARALRLGASVAIWIPLAPAYLSHAEINGVPPVWTVGYLDQFAVGMLLAVALEVVPSASIASARRALLAGLCVAFGANFLYGSGAQSPYGNGSGVLFAPLMAFAFALLLASSLVSPRPTVLGRILTAKPILAAGTISYGIYLWHFLVIQRLQAWGLWSSAFVNLAFVAAITATAAIGSWFLIERPALRLKDVQLPRPIGRPVPATAPAAVSPT